MEMGIGFILGIIFLEATLFLIGCFSNNDDYIVYTGTGLFYFPIAVIFWVYCYIRNYFFNRKYLRCLLCQEPCLCDDTIVIERKDLDKFYWKGENEFYVEPIFYIKCDGRHYKKMKMDFRLNDKKMLSYHKEKKTRIYRQINLYLRKENKNGN